VAGLPQHASPPSRALWRILIVPVVSRWTLLSYGAAAAVALSGCANVSGRDNSAPPPAKSLPSALASLVKTDVGQYLVKPRAGTSSKDVQATIATLRAMPGVQSAALNNEGKIDLELAPNSTATQRGAAVKQLAALGEVEEGI
jgi:hypothetical protein